MSKNTNFLAHDNRYKAAGRVVLALTRTVFKWKFGFSYDKMPEIDGPCIYLANHTTDFDFLFISHMIGKHSYIVGTENILRNKLLGKFLLFFFYPIFIVKGKLSLKVVADMTKVLKAGSDVMLFPEGNRCFNGVTEAIPPATAKLIKAVNCNVVLLRIEGGYFTQPRFSRSLRKGKVHVSLSNIIKRDQVKSTSVEDLTKLINDGLYEDAYARQEAERIKYSGKALASGLETTIYACPHCRQIGKLKSYDNVLKCECGYSLSYDEYGDLSDTAGKKTTIKELVKFQEELLREEMVKETHLMFCDTIDVMSIDDHKVVNTISGVIEAYPDRLEFKGNDDIVVDFSHIEGVAIYKRNVITVNLLSGKQYEIRGNDSFNGLKYINYYKEKEGKR